MRKMMIPWMLLVLTACTSNKAKTTAENDKVVTEVKTGVQADTVVQAVDAITSATSKPNDVSFNGTLVIPLQYYATVTLTLGGIVKNTSLLPGIQVSKGAVLATLENPEFIALQQTYLDSRAQLEFLEAEYKRQGILAKEEAASQKKFQQSKADYLSMKSREQAAAAQLSLLGVKSEELLQTGIRALLEVKAPISGYVGNVRMNLGKHVAAGETLCEVINKEEMLIRLVAYEKDLANIHTGDAVEFMVNGIGNKKFRATLISVGQQVDEVSRSLEVYAKIADKESVFRPGMYVSARIVNRK